MVKDHILIIDFGGQYSHSILRSVHNFHVQATIIPFHQFDIKQIDINHLKGIILSGGPASTQFHQAPLINPHIFDLAIPVLGICYGHQLIATLHGGQVTTGLQSEFGKTSLNMIKQSPLFDHIEQSTYCWMSHNDAVTSLSTDFEVIATTPHCPIAAFQHLTKPIYGIQFHPETQHTPWGQTLFNNFLTNICQIKANWNMTTFVADTISWLTNTIGNHSVICAVSGGVDSLITANLVYQAVQDQLQCIFVDTGLLRHDEVQTVQAIFKHYHIPLITIDASSLFLKQLQHKSDPEQKRMIIADLFMKVFQKAAKQINNVKFFVQGTIYSDVVESGKHLSAKIKSHHNVVGITDQVPWTVIEPMKDLFKDELRVIGQNMHLLPAHINRPPFPGPGLAIRIIGEVTLIKLNMLRQADDILQQEMMKAGWDAKIWQYFVVLTDTYSVGVQGDQRTYLPVLAIRAVHSQDGMTAQWVHLPYELLEKISNRLTNEISGINRVVYDITTKPPATIEWE